MADTDQNFGAGLLGYVMLMDPTTGKPYKAENIVQQTDGEFSTAGLASESKQDQEIAAIQALIDRMDDPTMVEVQNTEWALPAGASTAAKQDTIITALGNLAALLGGDLNVSINGEPLDVAITSSTLPTGAASSANQADIKSALDDVLEALTGVLSVSGAVDVSASSPLSVTGSVHLDNTSLSVTPSGTFNVSVSGGSTAAKQDEVIATLGNVLTRLNSPLAITDNNASVTVDGTVGISGAVPVTDNGGSITVDGGVNATQAGTWNVGITGTPAVTVSGPVTITDGAGPLTVDGTVVIGNSSAIPVSLPGTQAVSLASVPSHPVSQSGAWTQTPTAASTLTTTPTNIAVGTTSVSLVAAQTGRRSLIVQNMGATTLSLSFAATAVATAPTFQIPANGWMVIDRETWVGAVTAIRASGSATADAVVTVTS